jgi:CHAT domain-containing protein
LITKTVAVMAADKSATKSDALRQAMMSLVEAGDLADAHPAIWAPFVVVGEAAR